MSTLGVKNPLSGVSGCFLGDQKLSKPVNIEKVSSGYKGHG